jgi:hypothetical protein
MPLAFSRKGFAVGAPYFLSCLRSVYSQFRLIH